ncbi:MAG: glycosyltransferase family 4 protein [Planctomycetota bacterium]|nr:glycosyltransferase family 4 protein [Planctomycetota bacterium]
MSEQNSKATGIRVAVQQPALPKYRVPVFRELAGREGIRMTLYYGDVPGLSNVEPAGFEGVHVPMWRKTVMGHPVIWHSPQWEYATREQADVLVLSWDVHYVSLVPALLRAKANGVPTILWGHGYSKQEAGWRALPRRKLAELATALMFYNHTAAKRYVEAGWNAKRIYVALNSLDQGPIQEVRGKWLGRREELEAFAQREGLTPGPVIIFVSRLEIDNRVDWLLEAAAKLKGVYPHLRIVVVGKGPDEPRLRELVGRLEMEEHAKFTGAIYEEEKLAPWMLSANVFCYPTNIGLSILHGLGYGLPVVTSDRTELQGPEIEALSPAENGMLYKHGDTGALAGALRQIIDDRELAGRLSAGALATVMERFNLKKMVDGFEAAIRYAHQQGSGVTSQRSGQELE